MNTRSSFLLAASLILLGAVMRFLPHPANVAPIAAIALFSGTYLKRWYAFVIPLAAMILSDAVIGFHSLIWATWGCFLVVGAIGLWVRRAKSVRRIVLGSLAGSIFFYLVTNWAVWDFTSLYSHSASGLLASYTAALPFFRNTMLGDLFYTGVFFGLYESIAVVLKKRAAQPVTAHSHDHIRD